MRRSSQDTQALYSPVRSVEATDVEYSSDTKQIAEEKVVQKPYLATAARSSSLLAEIDRLSLEGWMAATRDEEVAVDITREHNSSDLLSHITQRGFEAWLAAPDDDVPCLVFTHPDKSIPCPHTEKPNDLLALIDRLGLEIWLMDIETEDKKEPVPVNTPACVIAEQVMAPPSQASASHSYRLAIEWLHELYPTHALSKIEQDFKRVNAERFVLQTWQEKKRLGAEKHPLHWKSFTLGITKAIEILNALQRIAPLTQDADIQNPSAVRQENSAVHYVHILGALWLLEQYQSTATLAEANAIPPPSDKALSLAWQQTLAHLPQDKKYTLQDKNAGYHLYFNKAVQAGFNALHLLLHSPVKFTDRAHANLSLIKKSAAGQPSTLPSTMSLPLSAEKEHSTLSLSFSSDDKESVEIASFPPSPRQFIEYIEGVTTPPVPRLRRSPQGFAFFWAVGQKRIQYVLSRLGLRRLFSLFNTQPLGLLQLVLSRRTSHLTQVFSSVDKLNKGTPFLVTDGQHSSEKIELPRVKISTRLTGSAPVDNKISYRIKDNIVPLIYRPRPQDFARLPILNLSFLPINRQMILALHPVIPELEELYMQGSQFRGWQRAFVENILSGRFALLRVLDVKQSNLSEHNLLRILQAIQQGRLPRLEKLAMDVSSVSVAQRYKQVLSTGQYSAFSALPEQKASIVSSTVQLNLQNPDYTPATLLRTLLNYMNPGLLQSIVDIQLTGQKLDRPIIGLLSAFPELKVLNISDSYYGACRAYVLFAQLAEQGAWNGVNIQASGSAFAKAAHR